MKSFLEYLSESSGKNLHLEHLEDIMFDEGVPGMRRSILFLLSLKDMLSGSTNAKVNVSVKWDGAPAIFAGINPENGKFFVGTKGVFNKNAKLNYTNKDIDKNHESEGLRKKLKAALEHLPKLNIRGVIQGDMLFTKGDITTKKIDGENMITFQPNTIMYAVPADSDLAAEMLKAKLGIIFHTAYTGKTMESMKANFNVNISSFTKTPDVWFRDAFYDDRSGTANFTAQETEQLDSLLSQAGTLFNQVNGATLNYIANEEELRILMKTYMNAKVRKGEPIGKVNEHVAGLIEFIRNKYEGEIQKLKTEKGKTSRQLKLEQMVSTIVANKKDITTIYKIQDLLIRAKIMILSKLQQIKTIGTFLQTDSGLKVTSPEGFVAIDHKGQAVKLVDRLEFSKANFTATKNWG